MPLEPLHNERELLYLIAASDEKAFETLVDHFWNKIYSIALLFTKSTELAKDVVQEVFMKVWSGRQSLPEIQKFDAWLFIVARNTIFNYMRKKAPLHHVDLHLVGERKENALSPEEALGYKQLQELIRQGVELLPPQQKLIFKMSREQGISHEEICEELKLARSTVKNALVKSLIFLRNYIRLHAGLYMLAIFLHFPLRW